MTTDINTARRAKRSHPVRSFLLSGAAALAAFAMAPSAAHAHDKGITISGLHFSDDEEFLEKLIEMDADDIDELREEMADARAEIAEAIDEIKDARADAADEPGGEAVVKIALAAAEAAVSSAAEAALGEVKSTLDRAEDRLKSIKSTLSAEEVAETQLAIDVMREEIASLEDALAELSAAMRA